MIAVRQERQADHNAREALLDRAYGDDRFRKCSQRLREGRLPSAGLSFVATERGQIVGTVRLWDVSAGPDRNALLLGPLAVAPEQQSKGIGGKLMKHAIAAARMRGHGAILLVGDAPYYVRFGFSAEKTGSLSMPGTYDPRRLLALELQTGAIEGMQGMIAATGRHAAAPAGRRRAAERTIHSPVPRAA